MANKLILKGKTYTPAEIITNTLTSLTVINNDGTKANWFSSINSSKVSQSVVAPIMEAILLLAKENTGYGTGSCMNDKLIVAEYKNGEERYDVCVFNVDKKQIESVTIKVLSEKKTKAYILDNSTNSGVVIWLAIIQFLLINNEDLEKSFVLLKDEINKNPIDTDEITRLAFVVHDYICCLTGVTGKASVVIDNGITANTFARLKQEDLNNKVYAPQTVFNGDFFLLDNSKQTSTTINVLSMEDLQKKYSLNIDNQENVPSLSHYVTPNWLEKVVKKIHRCAGSKTPAYNVCLIGTSGSGKTTGAMAIAQILGVPYGVIEFDRTTDFFKVSSEIMPKVSETTSFTDEDIEFDTESVYETITGLSAPEGLTPNDVRTLINNMQGNGNGVSYTELVSVLAKNFEKPCVIEFKECLTAQNLTFLNGLLEANGEITLASGITLKRHPFCVIVATSNATYSDVLEPDASFRARFMRNTHIINTPTEKELADRLSKNLSTSFPEVSNNRPLIEAIVKINTELEKFERENQMRNTVFGYLFCEAVAIEYATLYEENDDITLQSAITNILPNAVSLTNDAKVEEIQEFLNSINLANRNFIISKGE